MKTKRFLQIDVCLKSIVVILINSSVLLSPFISSGQNVGIGTDNPTEKLQVAGKVFSSEEGFKFPDGSVQSRAYNAYETQDAGDARWIIIMDLVNPPIPGSFTFGQYVGKVKVLDYQWGMTMDPVVGSGALTVKTLKIVKNIDLSTNLLLQRALNGTYFLDIRLYLPGQGMITYYSIYLEELIITAFDQRMVFKGGENYSHLDCIEFEFSNAQWIFNEGGEYNEANYSSPE
jgi:type VI protein secretion system component Hcp